MPAMVVQLGLATIPFGRLASVCPLTSDTTSGTSGFMRHADELSITIAPAAATVGAKASDVVLPALNSAISRPLKSAVAASSTTTGLPFQSSVVPADRLEAK